MLGGIGTSEVILILLVIIIFFGAEKIPELARGLGQGMSEFKKASDSIKKEIDDTKRNFSEPPKKQKADTAVKEEVVEDEKENKNETQLRQGSDEQAVIEKDKSKNS